MKFEFLALKWAMTEKFREYLLGQRCVVFTDNNPLSYLQTAKLGAQLAVFDFEVKYRSGRSNRKADALSRQYLTRQDLVDQALPGTIIPSSLGGGIWSIVRHVRDSVNGFGFSDDVFH